MWLKKLEKNPRFLGDYKVFVQDIIVKGYAQKVPEHQRGTGYKGKTWLIPHHKIYSSHNLGKICVVFECLAKYKGNSYNDQLMKGPDITNSLLGILVRFRQEGITVMTNTEEMFHQVKLPFISSLYVHLVGAMSSPACANFSLQKTADNNVQHFSCDVINTVRWNFYINDCLKSLPSVKVAIALVLPKIVA